MIELFNEKDEVMEKRVEDRAGILHFQETYNYDASGKQIAVTTSGGTTQTLYDSLGRISVSLDPLGNATTYTYLGEEIRSYTHDYLSQLTSENEESYTYDSLYNRTSKNESEYTLNSLFQILSDGLQNYEYDPNGNLLADSDHVYEYDSLDRLISVTCNDEKTTYSYDPFNRRIFKNTTPYIWDGKNEIGSYNKNELRILG